MAEEQNNQNQNANEELETMKAEMEKLRKAMNSASADAAKYKKQLAEKMTDEEKVNAERLEQDQKTKSYIEELESKVKDMNRKSTISDFTAKLVKNGYDSELATKSAEALADGQFGTFFDNLGKHLDNLKKNITEELYKGTPKPNGGGSVPKEMTKEEFAKLSYSERIRVYNENRELYDKLQK